VLHLDTDHEDSTLIQSALRVCAQVRANLERQRQDRDVRMRTNKNDKSNRDVSMRTNKNDKNNGDVPMRTNKNDRKKASKAAKMSVDGPTDDAAKKRMSQPSREKRVGRAVLRREYRPVSRKKAYDVSLIMCAYMY